MPSIEVVLSLTRELRGEGVRKLRLDGHGADARCCRRRGGGDVGDLKAAAGARAWGLSIGDTEGEEGTRAHG